jgi:formamidopyrimidine-DNA glycosylase
MPELPEVEATRVHLTTWTVGRVITDLTRHDAALDPQLDTLVGLAFTAWTRHGKALVATLSDGRRVHAHLGMTGRWARDADPSLRARLTLTFSPAATSGSPRTIAYADTRRLGTTRVLAVDEDPFASLGPDAWRDLVPTDPAAVDRLATAIGTGAKPLKDRLLDQSRIAGLGNIAVLEAAFRAGLHPHVPVGQLTRDDLARLVAGIHAHLEATLDDALATDALVYVNEGGPNPFLVYGREGEPCPRCQHPVKRALHAGRPSFTCPRCQPEGAKA